MRKMLTVLAFLLTAYATACVPMNDGYGPAYAPGYRSGYNRAYRAPYVGRPGNAYYAAPAGYDPANECLVNRRFCPQVLYYSDTNPMTEKRLSTLEGKVELQSKQILVLAENDKLNEENYRLVVAFMRKNKMTLDQVVGQYKTTCEQFMKNPKVIKDEMYRAKQIKFCEGLDSLSSGSEQPQKLAPVKDEPASTPAAELE